jgi:hypothetical protein
MFWPCKPSEVATSGVFIKQFAIVPWLARSVARACGLSARSDLGIRHKIKELTVCYGAFAEW